MDEQTPTSPPGSWPVPDVNGHSRLSDDQGQVALESPTHEDDCEGLPKSEMKARKREALLPAEILEQ